MMNEYNVAPLSRLIEQFERMPGIGHKTALRLAYYILRLPHMEAQNFANAITEAHTKIKYCSVCCNLTDKDVCSVCSDERRDHSLVCVVEDPRDVMALERTHEYKALYHVLHGTISPVNGVTPDMIHIKELLERLKSDDIREVIMATNPNVEGEATAMYISKLIKPLDIKVTRLAYGVPAGGDIEYADEVTLARALAGRNEI